MKQSNSKSQLVTTKSKTTHEQHDHTITTRTKAHSKTTHNHRDNTSKPIIKIKDQSEITAIKKQQLYTIIETFYSTLCDLPL